MDERERLLSALSYNPETGDFTWINPSKYKPHLLGKTASSLNDSGYVIIRFGGKNYKGHRLAWLFMTGDFPKNQVDHKDRDKANNKWSNLRLASNSENGCNKSMQSNNKSGYRGVFWSSTFNKWQAKVTYKGKNYHVGLFEDLKKASDAYKVKAKELHKEFLGECE